MEKSCHHQIHMRGEKCSHHVTLYLKSITLPSIWTTGWPETSLWGLYIWRASMWSKQANGHLETTDTLVNIQQILTWTNICLLCALHWWLHDCECSQSCCRLAAACRWAAEAFQMCTTPSSCTSTGEARPQTARSTRWTDADTRWRYSRVSGQLCSVTNDMLQHAGAVHHSFYVFLFTFRCT